MIRVRACLAAVQDDKLLLVPHYQTDAGATQWNIPGGSVEFGESVQETALREFREETGLRACITGLLDVSEVIRPEQPWHSITITFAGTILEGELATEVGHPHGTKIPRWFSRGELVGEAYHPPHVVEKALAIASHSEAALRQSISSASMGSDDEPK